MATGNNNDKLSDLLSRLGGSSNLDNAFNLDGETNADFMRSKYTPLSDRLINNDKYLKSQYNLDLPSEYNPSQKAQSGYLSNMDAGYNPYRSRLDSRNIEAPYSAGLTTGNMSRGKARGANATSKGKMGAPAQMNKRLAGKGAIQTDLSGFLAGIPTNIDEEATLRGFGNANFGGKELRFSGGINGNEGNIARSGIVGGNLADRTGFVSSQDGYDFSRPLSYLENSQNISPNSQGQISYEGNINANLSRPDSLDYNQQMNVSNAGSAGIAQFAQGQGQGESEVTANEQSQGDTTNPAQAIFQPFQKPDAPLKSLSNLLLGNGATTVVSDIAQTQAQSGLNNASSGTLTAPGDAQMSQGTSTAQQSQTTSPVFGNTSQSDAGNSSQSNQNLSVGQGGGTAQASSATQGNSQANNSVEQTQINTAGGLIPGTGDSTTLVSGNSQAQSQQQLQNETAAQGNATAASNNAGAANAGTQNTNTANQGAQAAQTTAQGGQAGTVQNAVQGGEAGSATTQTTSNSGNPLSGAAGVGNVLAPGVPLEKLGELLFGGKTTTTQENIGAQSGTNATQNAGSTGDAQSQASAAQNSSSSAQGQVLGNQVNTSTGTNLNSSTQTTGNAIASTTGNAASDASGNVDATKSVTSGGLFGRTKTQEEIQAEAAANAAAQSGANLQLGNNSSGQANQAASAEANSSNNLGLNLNAGANTNAQTQGSAQGQSTLTGQAGANANQSLQGASVSNGKDWTASTLTGADGQANSNSQLIATLQGSGANVQGQSQAQAALSGTLGAAAKTQVEIQAKRFITDLEKALPNDPTAQAAIARMKQDPSLVWLFDGSNSPKSVIQAIANSATFNSQTGQQAGWSEGNGSGGWTVQRTIASGTAGNTITIDPNNPTSNGTIRYYQDPQTGKTFANVQGEVREVKQGQLIPINFNDKVTVTAQSRANGMGLDLASTNLDVAGDIKGTQYYYAGGGDSIYDQLANEVIARANNTYKPTLAPTAITAPKTLDPSGVAGANTYENFDAGAYLAANPDVARARVDAWQHYIHYGAREGRAFTYNQPFLNSVAATNAQNTQKYDADMIKYNQDLEQYNKQLQDPNSTSKLYSTLNDLRSKNISKDDLGLINNYITQEQARRQQLAQSGQTEGLDTLVDYNDFFQDSANSPYTQKYGDIYKNYGYDDAGNVLYQGNSVSKYSDLLDAYGKEYGFDQKYGYDLGGNALDLSNVRASGAANNALAQTGYIPTGGGWQQRVINNDANLTVNGVDMSQNPDYLRQQQELNPYQKLTFNTSNQGIAEANSNVINGWFGSAAGRRAHGYDPIGGAARRRRAWSQTDMSVPLERPGWYNTPGLYNGQDQYNQPNTAAFDQNYVNFKPGTSQTLIDNWKSMLADPIQANAYFDKFLAPNVYK